MRLVRPQRVLGPLRGQGPSFFQEAQHPEVHHPQQALHLVLRGWRQTRVCVPRAFQPQGDTFDERFVFVGPSIQPRGDTGDFPFSHLEGGPALYISLGTVFNNWPDFYRMCFAAFGGTPWRVVLATGHAVNAAKLGPIPDNFLVRPSVPQLEVLERTSVFVTHGGANSLMEAFHYGVPVVVIPQMAEQPLNAQRVAELELGLALEKETVTVEQLRQSVERVSSEPAFREKVRTMQQEVRASGGYRRAVEAILAFRDLQSLRWDRHLSFLAALA